MLICYCSMLFRQMVERGASRKYALTYLFKIPDCHAPSQKINYSSAMYMESYIISGTH